MARRRKRSLGDPNVTWKSGRPQAKFADGPRQVAKIGACRLEVFEWCNTKKGSRTPCPSGEFSYVVIKRGVVKAAGPHGAREGDRAQMFSSTTDAKTAAISRAIQDPKLGCKRR